MSLADYADLTKLQKIVLLEQWNKEQKEIERLTKGGR